MQKEKISIHLLEILLTQQAQVSSLVFLPTLSQQVTLKVRVEEEEEGQGCPKALSSQDLPSCGSSGNVFTGRGEGGMVE